MKRVMKSSTTGTELSSEEPEHNLMNEVETNELLW